MAMFAAVKRSAVATGVGGWRRALASLAVGSDIVSAAPGVSLQKARTWDEGVSSKFSTTPLSHIFHEKKVVIFGLPGAYTGVCSAQHVPSYKNNIDKFKAKGIDSVICVAINDPYVMNGWAEKLQANEAIEFYGDFDGSFHKSLDLGIDLSAALLGHRSQRWSAYVVDGKVKVLNVEKVPSEFKVSGGEDLFGHNFKKAFFLQNRRRKPIGFLLPFSSGDFETGDLAWVSKRATKQGDVYKQLFGRT